MLVVRERSSGMTMATVAPRKSSGEWLGKRVMAFMREAGCEVEAVVMKTDNEPALVKVVEEVGRLRAANGVEAWWWKTVLCAPARATGTLGGVCMGFM